jgi:hypothetical protein
VQSKADHNLLKYAQHFKKPKDLIEDLAQNIPAFSRSNIDRACQYMRWMVRSEPDLQIYRHLLPEDLYVPLTKENVNVVSCLGVIPSGATVWRDEHSEAEARQKLTDYAKHLFPHDPAKVDYPFFLLGRWLKQKTLNRYTLKTALDFLDRVQKVTGQSQAYYEKMSRYKSGWKKDCANHYFACTYPMGMKRSVFPYQGSVHAGFYTRKESQGRKIILEPHFEMTKRQARKYALF